MTRLPTQNQLINCFWLLVTALSVRLVDLLAWWQSDSERIFAGQVAWFDPEDVLLYWSAIVQGQAQPVGYHNPFNASASAKPVYLVYTLWGYLTQFWAVPVWWKFHLLGVMVSLALLWYVKQLLSHFLPHKWHWPVIWLLVWGGGLGWWFWPGKLLPDLGLPHFNLYLAARQPHDGLSLAMQLVLINQLWHVWQARKTRLWQAGLASLILGLIHPFMWLWLAVVAGGLSVISWARNRWQMADLKPWLSLGLTLSLSAGFYWWLVGADLWQDSDWQSLTREQLLSPSVWQMIVASLPLIVGVWYLYRTKFAPDKVKFWLAYWLLASLVLYLPVDFQRLMVRGWWLGLVMLAFLGWYRWLSQRQADKLIWLLMLFCLLSSAVMQLKLWKRRRSSPWVYLTAEQQQLLDQWQIPSTAGQQLSLASTGMWLAAQGGQRLWLGHPHLTPEFELRARQAMIFYQDQLSDKLAWDWLQTNQIDWVWLAEEESQLAGGDLDQRSYLKPVRRQGNLGLYQVVDLKAD